MIFDKSFPKWARKLTFGHVVCDCRYRHVAIKNYGYEDVPLIGLHKFFYAKWMPTSIGGYLASTYEDVCDRLGLTKVWDIHIELADGASCSVRNCCSQADHDEGVHYKIDES